MNNKRAWIIRLLIILFTVSISFAIVPCGVVNVYGALGEVYSSGTIEAEKETQLVKEEVSNVRKEKGINIYNVWFALCVMVLCISYVDYAIRLPRGDTIVTLKVRMDN